MRTQTVEFETEVTIKVRVVATVTTPDKQADRMEPQDPIEVEIHSVTSLCAPNDGDLDPHLSREANRLIEDEAIENADGGA